jgi:cytochrome c oxidase cbb3-type subunit III
MRRLNASLALAALAAVGACTRDQPVGDARAPERAAPRAAVPRQGPGVQPGISPQAVLGEIRNPHVDDPAAILAGRQLFTGMNCAGCHSSYAGGGMGPSLRDSLWLYGSGDVQIFSTIAEGRPYGMPAWAGRLTDDQIWQIVAYINPLGTPDEPIKPPTPSHGDQGMPATVAGR